MQTLPFSACASIVVLLFAAGCGANGNSSGFSSGTNGGAGGDDASASADAFGGTAGIPVLDASIGDTAPIEAAIVEGGYDVVADVELETTCTDAAPEPAQILTSACTPPTDNECDGAHDPTDMQGHTLPNGLSGNGFDDDCDGLVDEGCTCGAGHPIGTTKDCYLLPSSWIDDTTKLPVGWCAQNSKGTVKCVSKGGTPEQPVVGWDGVCRGASPPFPDDFCAMGDFNCDGVNMNPTSTTCGCVTDPVKCPVDPLKMNPFPNAADLTAKDQQNPLVDPSTPFIVDGYNWIDPQVQAQATDWQWTLTGGDCDNVLPHPTFAIYKGANGFNTPKIGQQVNTLGANGKEHGLVTPADSTQHQIFPAFSLSGDYVATGKFTLQGQQYQCSVKIQVRAPGIRAELCWDHVGNDGDNDVDLHFARLQGNNACTQHGWFFTCGQAPDGDDCYYNSGSGCPSGGGNPGWGYADSHSGACHGWGSLRTQMSACTNPRLDRDNISCMPNQSDPNSYPLILGQYCGPENINLDNPNAGDRFLVGAQCYDCVGSTHAANHPHVNVYCNGNRVLSSGYDPTQPGPYFPALVANGADSSGSLWSAAIVQWTGDPANPCQILPVPSQTPNPSTDGSVDVCVENGPQNLGATDPWLFTPSGAYPATPQAACWH